MVVLQPIQQNSIHRVRNPDLMFKARDERPFALMMRELQREHAFLRTRYHDNMADYIFHPEKLKQQLGFRCLLVPSACLTILPDGKALVCFGVPDSEVGDLRTQPVEELWRARHTRQVQDTVRAGSCRQYCWETHQLYNLYLLEFARMLPGFGVF